jgi:sarcosine oxidase subunit alpha
MPQAYARPDEEIRALQKNVGLVDLSAHGKLLIRGLTIYDLFSSVFDISIPQPGEVHQVEPQGATIAALLPDEALIITPPGVEDQVASQLEAEIENQDLFVTVLDQTSALAGVGVYGPLRASVLEKLSALSFHPEDFPAGRVVQGSLAKIRATIIHRNRMGTPGFEIYVDRSYGEYLWETLMDAGTEFGIRPMGWGILDQLAGGQ